MTTQPANVSVTLPISPAIERVKLLLFRPFDLGKWFTIGFCAWLATLGQQGGFNYRHRSQSRLTGEDLREWFERARDYVMNNLNWLLPLTIVLVVFAIACSFTVSRTTKPRSPSHGRNTPGRVTACLPSVSYSVSSP